MTFSVWNAWVKIWIFSIKRSQAVLRSRYSLVTRYSFQIRNVAYILTGSPVRYFFARKSPAVCSSAGCFQRLVCNASRRGASPYIFQFFSLSYSKSIRKRPRGRVISYMTSLSLFPSSRKRICCSVPIKIRSFILSLSNARTKRMWS